MFYLQKKKLKQIQVIHMLKLVSDNQWVFNRV